MALLEKKNPMAIPNDVTREELVQVWHQIRSSSNDDKKKFEEWYKKQFDYLDKLTIEIDSKQK